MNTVCIMFPTQILVVSITVAATNFGRIFGAFVVYEIYQFYSEGKWVAIHDAENGG